MTTRGKIGLYKISETGQDNATPVILRAAIEEFDEVGFTAASIARIAQRAGVSKSLVSYHFPAKIFLASTVVHLAYPNGVFMGVPRHAVSPLEAIVEATEHVADSVAHTQLARVAIRLHRRKDVRADGSPDRYSGWLARISDYFEEARQLGQIPEDSDVSYHARLLVAGVAGLLSLATDTNDYLTIVDDARAMVQDRISLIWVEGSLQGKA
ncbi:TetR/AcrR family transcriptional regulator [Agromyces larvae]|uniref:TetR/AcrR family transcriptional regulator n=1 Tax=Agromyces larvae TaxID=2929802 RepID=A0ABY4BZM0_9MICO|nr:TetR/AcrR family transcriptional regulator [Agromyces larvae]UOE43168.1 TetR/AcrR family transcriptional regulator [Agromyces larvae]